MALTGAEKQARYRAAHPEYMHLYREDKREGLVAYRLARQSLWQAELATHRAGGCTDCGGEGVLFHHVDPSTKLFNISGAYGRPAAARAAELAKCVVLCIQCHANRHKDLRP